MLKQIKCNLKVMADYPMVLYAIPTKDRILIKNSHKK